MSVRNQKPEFLIPEQEQVKQFVLGLPFLLKEILNEFKCPDDATFQDMFSNLNDSVKFNIMESLYGSISEKGREDLDFNFELVRKGIQARKEGELSFTMD